MLSKQSALARLPVPNLQSTLDQYLTFCRPLVSAEAYEKTVKIVSEFRSSPVAQSLHQQLVALSQQPDCSNWLSRWWSDSYLMDRSSPGIYVSPVLTFKTPSFVTKFAAWNDVAVGGRGNHNDSNNNLHATSAPYNGVQSVRAAVLVEIAMRLRHAIDARSLDVDSIRGKPLCMLDYDAFFCGARIPALGRDIIVSHQSAKPSHAVVLCNGRIFALQVMDVEGKPIAAPVLHRAISRILAHSASEKATPSVLNLGLVTAADRDTWAAARAGLMSSAGNRKVLHLVESATFVLTLDAVAVAPDTPEELHHLWHGTTAVRPPPMGPEAPTSSPPPQIAIFNRWYDKSLHIHVAANGVAGATFEHSAMDSLPVLTLAKWVAAEEAATWDRAVREVREGGSHHAVHDHHRTTDAASPSSAGDGAAVAATVGGETPEAGSLGSLHVANWEELVVSGEDTPNVVHDAIAKGREALTTALRKLDVAVMVEPACSAAALRALGMSPDAFAQLSMQIAFQRTEGYVPSTYESASTKTFLSGRTETLRPVTRDSQAFVEAFNGVFPMAVQAAEHYGDWDSERRLQRAVPQLDTASGASAPSSEQITPLKRLEGSSTWKLIDALTTATARHASTAQTASSGQGCDRHLLALHMLALESGSSSMPLPSIFTDPTYATYRTINLSTSHPLSFKGMHSVVGFGPVSADCIGVGYFVAASGFTAGVTSWRFGGRSDMGKSQNRSARFVRELRRVCRALIDVAAEMRSDKPHASGDARSSKL